MSWIGWNDLGTIPGAPAVASSQVGHLSVFTRGANGHLLLKNFNEPGNPQWDANWSDLGAISTNPAVNITGTPAAVSWGLNRIDCFARGTDNKLHHTEIKAGKCDPFPWDNLGGGLSSSPTAASWKGVAGQAPPGNTDRLYVFARGTDTPTAGYPWHRYWDGTWQKWDGDSLGHVNIIDAPAAVSWGPTRIDLFAHWSDNTLRHNVWDGKWASWDSPTNNLGGVVVGSPAAASWGHDRVDVFVRDTTNTMSRRTWTPATQWKAWEPLGGDLNGSPAVVSWGPNRIDCFATGAVGTVNHLYHKVLTN